MATALILYASALATLAAVPLCRYDLAVVAVCFVLGKGMSRPSYRAR